jgi:hypothetical protein
MTQSIGPSRRVGRVGQPHVNAKFRSRIYLATGRARAGAGWSDKGTGLLVVRIDWPPPPPLGVAASTGALRPRPPRPERRAKRRPPPRRRPKRLRRRPKKNPNWSPNSTKSWSASSDVRAASASAAAAADMVATTDTLAKSPRRQLRRFMRRPLLLARDAIRSASD